MDDYHIEFCYKFTKFLQGAYTNNHMHIKEYLKNQLQCYNIENGSSVCNVDLLTGLFLMKIYCLVYYRPYIVILRTELSNEDSYN